MSALNASTLNTSALDTSALYASTLNASAVDSSTDYTFSYSKYSCMKSMFLPHVILSYTIMISGLLSFITRFWFIRLHSWMGRLYILSMLWNTGISLLIHNTGLPLGVLISFIWVLGGLTFGWISILLHKELRPSLDTKLKKLFSFRILHGVLMFMSWLNITGRIFASDISHFDCQTYPIYKDTLRPVPILNPNYNKLPWANIEWTWGAMLSLGPIAAGFIVAAISIVFEKKAKVNNLLVNQ